MIPQGTSVWGDKTGNEVYSKNFVMSNVSYDDVYSTNFCLKSELCETTALIYNLLKILYWHWLCTLYNGFTDVQARPRDKVRENITRNFQKTEQKLVNWGFIRRCSFHPYTSADPNYISRQVYHHCGEQEFCAITDC